VILGQQANQSPFSKQHFQTRLQQGSENNHVVRIFKCLLRESVASASMKRRAPELVGSAVQQLAIPLHALSSVNAASKAQTQGVGRLDVTSGLPSRRVQCSTMTTELKQGRRRWIFRCRAIAGLWRLSPKSKAQAFRLARCKNCASNINGGRRHDAKGAADPSRRQGGDDGTAAKHSRRLRQCLLWLLL